VVAHRQAACIEGHRMKFVGLSGGIGSGKSTVAAKLVERGAHVIDADVLSRELQQPGHSLFDQIVARWGAGVLDAEGRLDREALGRIVFADQQQLTELTMMAGPATEQELVRRAAAHQATDADAVVVAEAAMYLVPMYGMKGLIVVDTPVEVAVRRLVQHRGMAEADARARIARQLTRETRLEHADFVIDNGSTVDALNLRVQQVWDWIRSLPDATPEFSPAASNDPPR
jgi:dephospho-CoA kinase